MRHARNGLCNKTVKEKVYTTCLRKWTERVMSARCCLAYHYFLRKRTTDVCYFSQILSFLTLPTRGLVCKITRDKTESKGSWSQLIHVLP